MTAPLPSLRDVIRRHDLMARKSLGQNFLTDPTLLMKVATTGGAPEGETVIEIGPGPGGLTRALLDAGARRVVAIERDERCLPALAEVSAHHPGRLEVVAGDALATDWRSLLRPGETARVVANLPYNIATPLLVGWLQSEPWPPWFSRLTLMFQREVADRIVAGAGDEAYGRLGVLAGWRTEASIAFDIPPGAFLPAPKVTSSVVHLAPRASPLPCRVAALSRVTLAAFGQRRKMLRQSLKGLFDEPTARLEALHLDPTARAEDLTIAAFVAIANALET